MEMAAVRTGREPGAATVEALLAGADLVLWSHTAAFQDAAVASLSAAAAQPGPTRRRLVDSFRRVCAAREELGRGRAITGTAAEPAATATTCAAAATASAGPAAPSAGDLLAGRLAARAVTMVRNDGTTLPLGGGGPGAGIADLTSLSGPGEAHPSPGEILAGELAVHGIRCGWQRIARGGGREWALQQKAAGRPVICLTRDAILKPAQAAEAGLILSAYPRAILVAVGLPYDLRCFPGATCCICTYDESAGAMRALAGVLAGRIRAAGSLPVSLG
jgi:beta-N-acetylhexosaminidase